MLNQKSARITVAGEIEKREKKKRFPEPATYKPDYKQIETRPLGCFSLKSDRCGFLEEAGVIGKEQAKYYDKNFKSVDMNLKYPRIHPMVEEKKVEKTSLSPASYEPMDKFKET